MLKQISNFIKESRRVLRVTKKPSKEEYRTIVKVSGLGILAIGLIGFVITLTKQIFLG